MTRSPLRRFFAPFFRAFSVMVVVVGSLCAWPVAPAVAVEKAPRMTPEQRRELWNQMSPQQREQWRNARASGEQRGAADQRPDGRGQISPEERQAMRQRFYERQQGSSQVPGNAPQRRQLSPEERQQLRQQIEQAQRNIYRRPDGGGNRGTKK